MTDDSRAFAAWPGSMPKIDTGLANVARAWNYMVGGKDNFEVDREAALRFLAGLELVEPGLVTVPEWRPEAGARRPAQVIPLYGVVARKP